MTKIQHDDEAAVESRLIEVLGEGHNQWNYRPDLKSEEDLWKNLRQKITQNNLSEIGDHPITNGEFERIVKLKEKSAALDDKLAGFFQELGL